MFEFIVAAITLFLLYSVARGVVLRIRHGGGGGAQLQSRYRAQRR